MFIIASRTFGSYFIATTSLKWYNQVIAPIPNQYIIILLNLREKSNNRMIIYLV